MVNLLTCRIPAFRNQRPARKRPDDQLGFDKDFAPHMFVCGWSRDLGWTNPRIVPFEPVPMSLAAPIINYGAGLFDGLELFYQADDSGGNVAFFRLQMHSDRLESSAKRMCVESPPSAFIRRACIELARVDYDQVPRSIGTALYFRPIIIGTEAFIGHRRSTEFLFAIFTARVVSYFRNHGCISLRVEERYTRAAPGGAGDAKNPGSYGAALLPAEKAQAAGYDHVLFTDVTHQYIEEAGTTSFFARIGDEIVTPPLGGTILESVMRDTNLRLLREWRLPGNERPIAVEELIAAYDRGLLKECWCTGTAGGVQAVGRLGYRGKDMIIGDNVPGQVTTRLNNAITDYRYGRVPDEFGWRTIVKR